MGMCLLTCSCLSFPYSCLGERFIVIWSSVDILILKCLMQILHEFITKLWDGQGIWTFSILCVILNPNLWKSSLSPMWITMIRTRNDYWQLQESNSESRGFFLGLAVEQRPVVVGICTDKMAWHFHQRISSGYLWGPLGLYGTPLQYSCLENPMDGGAWWATVHWVAKSQTRLSDFTFTFHFHALEKEMATHSSVLGWRIPGTAEPGGLPSMESHRVGHDWRDSSSSSSPRLSRKKTGFRLRCGLYHC